MTTTNNVQFHLIRERCDETARWAGVIEIPEGVWYFRPDAGLLPAGGAVPVDACLIEPAGARLLLVTPPGKRAWVNGAAALRVAALEPGDEVQLHGDAGEVLHVVQYRMPEVRTAGDVAGKPCPVCRVPLEKNDRVYACPCGALMHLEGEREDALRCAALASKCPVCSRPILTEAGYSHLPEGYADA